MTGTKVYKPFDNILSNALNVLYISARLHDLIALPSEKTGVGAKHHKYIVIFIFIFWQHLREVDRRLISDRRSATLNTLVLLHPIPLDMRIDIIYKIFSV